MKHVNDHTHPGNAAKVEILHSLTNLRECAGNTQDPTAQVVTVATNNLTQAAQGALSHLENLKRTVHHQRVVNLAALANPASLADLQIPLEYTQYEKHPRVFENFLLFDSGPPSGDDRFLIFSTERNLDLLRSSEWLMDGTFDTAPPLFTQIYSIHGTHLGRTHPLVFALLPNKRQATYESMFTELKNISPRNLNPTSVLTDFEMAAIQATRSAFPTSHNSARFFHLSQNIYRKIQQSGLQHRYEEDADFALQCKMIPALAFVPPQDVSDAFEELSDYLHDALQPVMDYFEDNYIERPGRRRIRRNPTFPIELWNVNNRDNARTTNAVEAWHRGVQSLLGEIHPTIWKLINGLIRCQKLRDIE